MESLPVLPGQLGMERLVGWLLQDYVLGRCPAPVKLKKGVLVLTSLGSSLPLSQTDHPIIIPPIFRGAPIMQTFPARAKPVRLSIRVPVMSPVLTAQTSILFLVTIRMAPLSIYMPVLVRLPRMLETVAVTLLAGTLLKEEQKCT